MESTEDKFLAQLVAIAKQASKSAYSPYSRFPVGAAVVTESGEIFGGCNVENASFGLTICAERNAIFQAVAKGHRKIKALAIYTPTDTMTMPCGACRQVIREFGDNVAIVSVGNESAIRSNIQELLPNAFGPESL